MGSGGGPVQQAPSTPANLAVGNAGSYVNAQSNPMLSGVMQQYSSGQMSLQQALSALGNAKGTGVTSTPTSGIPNTSDLNNQMASIAASIHNAGYNPDGSSMDPGNRTQMPPQIGQLLAQYQNLKGQVDQVNNGASAAQTAASQSPAGDSLANQAMINEFLTNAQTGSMAASDFVRHDGLTSGLFGAGGIQDQAQGNYGKLMGQYQNDYSRINPMFDTLAQDSQNLLGGKDQSYGLSPQDLAAYGQAAEGITRQYGASANALGQQLANQGLASGYSGIAGANFTGLQGSQNEQLANAQLQIAQARIATAQQLAQAKVNSDVSGLNAGIGLLGTDTTAQNSNNALISNLGNLGQEAISNQYQRQLAGSQQDYNSLAGSAGLQMQNEGLTQNINNSIYGLENNSSGPSLGSILGGAVGNAAGIAGGIVAGNAIAPTKKVG